MAITFQLLQEIIDNTTMLRRILLYLIEDILQKSVYHRADDIALHPFLKGLSGLNFAHASQIELQRAIDVLVERGGRIIHPAQFLQHLIGFTNHYRLWGRCFILEAHRRILEFQVVQVELFLQKLQLADKTAFLNQIPYPGGLLR